MVPSHFLKAILTTSDKMQVLPILILTLSKKYISGVYFRLYIILCFPDLIHLRLLGDLCLRWGHVGTREKSAWTSSFSQWDNGDNRGRQPKTGRFTDFKTGNPVTKSLAVLHSILWTQPLLHWWYTVYCPQYCKPIREQRSSWYSGKMIEFK